MKKSFLSNWITLASIAVGALLTGCGGGGHDLSYHAWYDVFGRYCYTGHPAPGCNFYSDGTKIIDIEDPYYAGGLTFGTWDYVDSFGFFATYTGWGWLSPNGILYDDFGFALNSPDAQEAGKDLIAKAQDQEQAVINKAAHGLTQRYALSEASAQDIAQTLHDIAVLGKNGGRSEKDLKDFAKKLTGIDANHAMDAYKKFQAGDDQAITGLKQELAANWNTDPETSQEIAKNLMGKSTWSKLMTRK